MAVFGEIQGVNEGDWFPSRMDLRRAGLHRHTVAGISGSAAEGADAVVLNAGYEDDTDSGDVIIYTGEGGNQSGRQVADQTFTKGNQALAVNRVEGLPVRVIRGFKHPSSWSPRTGYTYAGLYAVDGYWHEPGKAGFDVYRYRLVKITEGDALMSPTPAGTPPQGQATPARGSAVSTRTVRDTEVTRWVKQQHDHRCQVCGERLNTPAGPYAEGAHIRPLGRPHNGPDIPSNLLCLCPNHHVLLDLGAFTVAQDLTLVGIAGRLHTVATHTLDPDALSYHRARVWLGER